MHRFLDFEYGPDGDAQLADLLRRGADLNERAGLAGETPLHVAVRRRRLAACRMLIEAGADIDTGNGYGKTSWVHARRRGFTEISDMLGDAGADQTASAADDLAIAMSDLRLNEAAAMLDSDPGLAQTGNPGEDRLLADMAGRPRTEPVEMLLDAGADLTAPGVDDGTPLHIAAWFGQPENLQLILDAGAPLEVFDRVHQSSPLGWAVHGSRYSGGADERQDVYVAIVRMLLDAGASMCYPDDAGDAYFRRLIRDASPSVRPLLKQASNTDRAS